MTLRKEASSSSLLSASAEDNPQDIHEPHRELFSLPLSLSALFLSSRSLGSLSLSSPYSLFLPSDSSLSSLLLLLPLLFLSTYPTPSSPYSHSSPSVPRLFSLLHLLPLLFLSIPTPSSP